MISDITPFDPCRPNDDALVAIGDHEAAMDYAAAVVEPAARAAGAVAIFGRCWQTIHEERSLRRVCDLVVIGSRGITAGPLLAAGDGPVVIPRYRSPAFAIDDRRRLRKITADHDWPLLGSWAQALTTMNVVAAEIEKFDVTRPRAFAADQVWPDHTVALNPVVRPVVVAVPRLVAGGLVPDPPPRASLVAELIGLDDLVTDIAVRSERPPAFYPDELAALAEALGVEARSSAWPPPAALAATA